MHPAGPSSCLSESNQVPSGLLSLHQSAELFRIKKRHPQWLVWCRRFAGWADIQMSRASDRRGRHCGSREREIAASQSPEHLERLSKPHSDALKPLIFLIIKRVLIRALQWMPSDEEPSRGSLTPTLTYSRTARKFPGLCTRFRVCCATCTIHLTSNSVKTALQTL